MADSFAIRFAIPASMSFFVMSWFLD